MESESSSHPGLAYITVPPLKKHTATVIFAHGIGESGHVWKPFAQQLQSSTSTLQHTKWILLHAPKRLVTVKDKIAMMPSWFNTKDAIEMTAEAEPQLLEIIYALNKLVEAEMVDSGLDSTRIFLGGVGQGGVAVIGAGLAIEKKLGGLIVLSATLPLKFQLKEMLSSYAKQLPIFWSIGSAEPLNNLRSAREGVEFLTTLGFLISSGSVTEARELKSGSLPKGILFNVYRGIGHATNKEELDSLTMWLNNLCQEMNQHLEHL
ncbi:Phospholipase/carboxylesterase [Gymnopus androsaceus JB14]|uniref:Acyl-protein thioesterase 1 n=1 Tax=Gymnopus androsaceus JB14 TaxID=1447944 RepID=A0A6A4I2S5_9AGAR|nr:Phospholipase/carboxylesterase [Gymnopus androsaceus JB14]